MKANNENAGMLGLILLSLVLFAGLFGIMILETPDYTSNNPAKLGMDEPGNTTTWSITPPEGYNRLAPPER
jgi:hypothetical protein